MSLFRHPGSGAIPDFTQPENLKEEVKRARDQYGRVADGHYDNAMDWLFQFFGQDETEFREAMFDRLEIQSDSTVLEIGCGTGRDTRPLSKRLPKGTLYTQDLSPKMVEICKARMGDPGGCQVEYFIGNATYLPFNDNTFDALFHYGGFNEFAEKSETLQEFARVVKKGGKVFFSDEAMGPWLRETEYGKIVVRNNPMVAHPVPLDLLPESAREVTLRFTLGNTFYAIDFRVGEGAPEVNLDLPHQGRRGGSPRTRYFGQLEGVTPEAKELAEKATRALGISMHEWLDRVVSEQAKKDLKRD